MLRFYQSSSGLKEICSLSKLFGHGKPVDQTERIKLILAVALILGDESVSQKTLQCKSKQRGYIAGTLRAPTDFNGSEHHPPTPHPLTTSPSEAQALLGATLCGTCLQPRLESTGGLSLDVGFTAGAFLFPPARLSSLSLNRQMIFLYCLIPGLKLMAWKPAACHW